MYEKYVSSLRYFASKYLKNGQAIEDVLRTEKILTLQEFRFYCATSKCWLGENASSSSAAKKQ